MIDFGDQLSAVVDKSNDDPAAAAAHDAQAPDLPVRSTVEKNVTSKGRQLLPPEEPGGLRGLNDHKAETSEEQRAEAVLQGGPDSPTQKLPPVIKSVILVANDDSENDQHSLLGAQEPQTQKTVGINAATESKEQGTEEELQKDSPVAKHVIIVANVNCKADIIGGQRRHFCSAAVDGHGGRGRRARVESARERRRASERARARRQRASG